MGRLALDWGNERYVRLYTRDTATWKLWCWQARALMPLLMRKADRSGIVEHNGYGARGIAALVDIPVDVVEAGLEDLAGSGTIELRETDVLLVNYIPANETPTTPAQRVRTQRERARARRNRDGPTRNDDNTSVTSGNAAFRDDTLNLTEQNLTEQNKGVSTSASRSRRRLPNGWHKAFVEAFDALYTEHRGGARPAWGARQGKLVRDLLLRPGGLEDALDRSRRMFTMAPRWPAENPDLATLAAHWDKFAPPVVGSVGTATSGRCDLPSLPTWDPDTNDGEPDG